MPPQSRAALLASLNDEDALALARDWDFWARDAQLPPDGPWRIWLFLGGRGAGKTRAGAEWIAGQVREGRMARIGLIGATHADARAVMVEGESGLLKVVDGLNFEPSNSRVLWPDGAVATLLSAEEPDSFRGHQFDGIWGDEFCKWREPQAALDMALMALRLGQVPRMLLTTTPRAIPALTALMESPGMAMTRSGTADNAANLADGFHDLMLARYGGTALGRQELDGELIADSESALWKRGWIEATRVLPLVRSTDGGGGCSRPSDQRKPEGVPEMSRVVVAVDPPASAQGDECGIVVAGRFEDEGYVLADLSAGGLTPAGWAARTMEAFAQFEADAIIAEANQGGEMVRSVLQQAGADAPVKLVHASRGKLTRAAPYAALYERGRIHHAGAFPELEDQMCNYDGGSGSKSPDRMDALVWALADLFAMPRKNPRIRRI